MGLMNFLEPFATGYLETKITGQEKRAEFIQKQNELADAKLAEIAKNRAIQLDNLEIENEEEFESAFENCEDILRNALPEQFDLDPEVEAALVDASLEFSQCMRDQGIDFPDPKPGEFGFFAFRDADIDFSSEEVQEAFEICQPENPLDSLVLLPQLFL